MSPSDGAAAGLSGAAAGDELSSPGAGAILVSGKVFGDSEPVWARAKVNGVAVHAIAHEATTAAQRNRRIRARPPTTRRSRRNDTAPLILIHLLPSGRRN